MKVIGNNKFVRLSAALVSIIIHAAIAYGIIHGFAVICSIFIKEFVL